MSQTLSSVVSLYNPEKQIKTIWSSIPSPNVVRLESQLSFVTRSSGTPYKFAIPNGRAINIYKFSNFKLSRRIPGFFNKPTCCDLKSNSKLLLAGEDNGVIRVCTTDKTTAHLRKLQTSSGKVTACKFSLEESSVFSLGSESVLKRWEIATGTELYAYPLNKGVEPAQALSIDRQSSDLVYAGDFSGKIHIIDMRMEAKENSPLLSVNEPILCIAKPNDSSNLLFASHGYNLSCFDLRAGSQTPLFSDRKHLKFISNITMSSNPDGSGEGIIISCGLDKMIKLTSTKDFSDIYQFKTRSSCLGVSSLDYCKNVVVGCENGECLLWSLPDSNLNLPCDKIERAYDPEHERGNPGGIDPQLNEIAELFSSEKGASYHLNRDEDAGLKTDEWFKKETDATTRIGPKNWGHVGKRAPFIHKSTEISRFEYSYITSNPKPLTKVDHLLRKFNHSDALFKSLRISYKVPSKRQRLLVAGTSKYVIVKKPLVPDHIFAISVIRELVRRGTLNTAVAGRSIQEIRRLLKFISDNAWQPDSLQTCMDLLDSIISAYKPNLLKQISTFHRVCNVIAQIEKNNQNFDHFMNILRNGGVFVEPTKADILPHNRPNSKKKKKMPKVNGQCVNGTPEKHKENKPQKRNLENSPSIVEQETAKKTREVIEKQKETVSRKKTCNVIEDSPKKKSTISLMKQKDLVQESPKKKSTISPKKQKDLVVEETPFQIKLENSPLKSNQTTDLISLSPKNKTPTKKAQAHVEKSPSAKPIKRPQIDSDEDLDASVTSKKVKDQPIQSQMTDPTEIPEKSASPITKKKRSLESSTEETPVKSPKKMRSLFKDEVEKILTSPSISDEFSAERSDAKRACSPVFNTGLENISQLTESSTPARTRNSLTKSDLEVSQIKLESSDPMISPKKLRSGKKVTPHNTPEMKSRTPRKSNGGAKIAENPIATEKEEKTSSQIPKPKIRFETTPTNNEEEVRKEVNDDLSIASKDSDATPSRRRSVRIARKKD